MTGIPFAAGEFIEFREPNAAGYGDPLERDPAMVREDVLDDFTTLELARDAYGVVFRTSALWRSTSRRRRRCGPSCAKPRWTLADRVLRGRGLAAVFLARLGRRQPRVRDSQ